jgi:putative endonuclease
VDGAKQKRLTRLATYWLQKKRLLDHPARFDVLAIGWPQQAAAPTIQHFCTAFEAAD